MPSPRRGLSASILVVLLAAVLGTAPAGVAFAGDGDRGGGGGRDGGGGRGGDRDSDNRDSDSDDDRDSDRDSNRDDDDDRDDDRDSNRDDDDDRDDDRDDDDGGKGRGRGGDRDRERLRGEEARAGVDRGEIASLPAILRVIRRVRPGKVLSVELVAGADRRLVYEVQVVDEDGMRERVRVDAKTNRLIDVRAR
jgi:uncharacterized membrane protein YkoI